MVKAVERRLEVLERVATADDDLIAIVLAAGKTPAEIEREVLALEHRLSAAGRRGPGPGVIVMDR